MHMANRHRRLNRIISCGDWRELPWNGRPHAEQRFPRLMRVQHSLESHSSTAIKHGHLKVSHIGKTWRILAAVRYTADRRRPSAETEAALAIFDLRR